MGVRVVFQVLAWAAMIVAAAMIVPILFAATTGDRRALVAFAAAAAGIGFLALAVLMLPRRLRRLDTPISGLQAMALVWVLIPVAAAAPVVWAAPFIDAEQAYFEMVSALTTTGASAIGALDTHPQAVILWRSVVGWLGGLFTVVAVVAIFEPLGIGGFEVERRVEGESAGALGLLAAETDATSGLDGRLAAALRLFGPAYGVATALCMLALVAAGATPFEAACYAMGALSTTGFVVGEGGLTAVDSVAAEAILALFLVLAATGARTHLSALRGRISAYRDDRELRYLGFLAGGTALLLFARHWVGAFETDSVDEIAGALRALWGAGFTALSYATTSGLESAFWVDARRWSGLETPGIVFLGVAMIGGSVASTAGGIKLMRAALLAKHSAAELSRLAHPSAVFTVTRIGRRVPVRALSVVWLFVMLYVVALAVCALALTATGLNIDAAAAAAIASIANAGPAYYLVEPGLGFTEMPVAARMILCLAMVVGRMEILALVVLLNPLRARV